MSDQANPLPPGHFVAGDIVNCGACKQIMFFDDPSSDEDDAFLAAKVLWRARDADRLCFSCGLPIFDGVPVVNEAGTPVDPFADDPGEHE